MTDKDSKNADKHEIENPLFEEHIEKDPANEGVKLDQLQDDFNSLLADSETSYSEASYAQSSIPQASDPQLSDHLNAESQHSTTQTAEHNVPEQQDQTPYKEATDAFNDLADAFTIDAAPASSSDNNDADFSSHLDQSFNAFESSSAHQNVNSDAQNNDLTTEQHFANDKFSAFESDEYRATSSFPISGDSIPNQGSDSPSENNSAIHADLSSANSGSAFKMPIMALAATVLIIIGAGIYWYTMGSTEKTVQIVQGEQLEMPEQANLSSTDLTEERMPATDKRDSSGQNDTIMGSEESNNSAQTETAIPASLSTEDAIKLITQKRARDAAQTSGDMDADSLDKVETASNTTPPEIQSQTPAPMQTSIPASTSTSSLAPTTSYDNGDWVIVAPVISKATARRYVASFKAKGIESEVLQRTSKGLDKYFIRILGFNSQQDAEKRIKRLSMIGLRNAKVLNAANSWEGNRVAMQGATPAIVTASAPSTTPAIAASQSASATVPQQDEALANHVPETAEADLAQQTSTAPVKAKAVPTRSKKQVVQLVSEFNLDGEPAAEADAIQQASELDVGSAQPTTSKANFKRVGKRGTQLLEQVLDIDAMPIDMPNSPIKQPTPHSMHSSIHASTSVLKQPTALSSDPLIRANEIYNLSRPTAPLRNSINRSKSFTRTVKAPSLSINRSSTQTYQRPVNTSPLDTQKRWTIVASVDSTETAKEYVDRFHSKYMESEAVELNVNGEVRHFVYIKGFTNQLSAQKRRDRLVNQSVLESTATVEEL